MSSDLKAKAKDLIIQYFSQLENKIDISTEKCLSAKLDENLINEVNNNRLRYLDVLNQTKQSILDNLDSLFLKWNGQNSLETIVFNNEYLIFIEPIYENDIGKCIGKLVKFDYYLSNEILDQLKLFLDQIRKEGFFTIETLDEVIKI